MSKHAVIQTARDSISRPQESQASWAWPVVFSGFVILIAIKVLWGYWERDLTSGDTSFYFHNAVCWHLAKMVNVVWSPLYTAYYGSWLSVSENAAVATFLHRLGLIATSTALVAWLALRTLPRLFALLLVCWWIALPIHYDTLYEVHLFGAIPVIALALVAVTVGHQWRASLLVGIALITTALIRNEFVLVIATLLIQGAANLLRNWHAQSSNYWRHAAFRHALVTLIAAVIIVSFYSASYIKGQAIQPASAHKHTLNMCQVYAFGYQQRNPAWKLNPWTECDGLMQDKFGTNSPSLKQMMVANPQEVAQHFLWNLSLTQAGLEVLLFNVTSSGINPDYAPVLIVPILPGALLGLSLLIIAMGTLSVYRGMPKEHAETRNNIAKLAPVMLAVVVMSIAVILTQRPRPSYLLGAGILYMWLVLAYLAAFTGRNRIVRSNWVFVILALILVCALPSYNSLPLLSKNSSVKLIYNALLPHQATLCQRSGALFLENYTTEISNYLCSKYWNLRKHRPEARTISIAALETDSLMQPVKFAKALDSAGVTAVVIDPFLIQQHPSLESCAALRDALLESDWELLSYSDVGAKLCIAAYIKGGKKTI
jgi:hypothetical protein